MLCLPGFWSFKACKIERQSPIPPDVDHGNFSRGKMIKGFQDEDQLIIWVDGIKSFPKSKKQSKATNVGLNITRLVAGHANVAAKILADSHAI